MLVLHFARLLFTGWKNIMTSSVGLVLSMAGWFLISDPTELKGVVIVVGLLALLTSSYRVWRDEHYQRVFIEERIQGFPSMVAPVGAIEEDQIGFIITTSDGRRSMVGDGCSIIRFRIKNDPIGSTPEAVAYQVRSTVTFLTSSRERLFDMDGRWSDMPQPPQLNQNQDLSAILAVDFQIGQSRSLDIAMKGKSEDQCFAHNNDSYLFPKNFNPRFKLPEGTLFAVVHVRGPYVERKWELTFLNDGNRPLKSLGFRTLPA